MQSAEVGPGKDLSVCLADMSSKVIAEKQGVVLEMRVRSAGCRVYSCGYVVQGSEFRRAGSSRVRNAGCRVHSCGYVLQGAEFILWGRSAALGSYSSIAVFLA